MIVDLYTGFSSIMFFFFIKKHENTETHSNSYIHSTHIQHTTSSIKLKLGISRRKTNINTCRVSELKNIKINV